MKVFWYLPTQGDERYLGTTIGRRPATYPYIQQIAQAVEKLGLKLRKKLGMQPMN